MMGDPFATSAFLDSSCFSILYPLYHHPDIMNHPQRSYPTPIQQHRAHAPPPKPHYHIGPTFQGEILSNAIGVPHPTSLLFAAAA